MKRSARTALLLVLLLLPAAGRTQEDNLDSIERDLAGVLKEMDAMTSELDRIKDIVAVPKASMLRVEVFKGGDLPAPVTARLIVGGKVEEEREWPKGERDAFAGGSPLVFQVPMLPGSYAGRFETGHASWKTPPAAEFRGDLKKGETLLLRVRLALPPGKTVPVLVPMTEK
jgi:hypothetical protein